MAQELYHESWDRPHKADHQELWQESDWLTFYDSSAGAGAVFRIGRQPNRGVGQPNLFCFIEGGDRFLLKDVGGRGLDYAMQESDVWSTGCRVGGLGVDALDGQKMRFHWDLPDTAADLEFGEAIYVPRGWATSDKGAEIWAWINPDGHLESAGYLRGRMRVGGRTVEINCLAHRDRSWGYRQNYFDRLQGTLGAWGSVGRSFSFASTMLHLDTGERLVTGFVSRNGTEEEIEDLAIFPTMTDDFRSPVSAVVKIILESGEKIVFDGLIAQAYGGFAPGVAFNSVGSFEFGGNRGFMDLAVFANPWGASTPQVDDGPSLVACSPGLTPTCSHLDIKVLDA